MTFEKTGQTLRDRALAMYGEHGPRPDEDLITWSQRLDPVIVARVLRNSPYVRRRNRDKHKIPYAGRED